MYIIANFKQNKNLEEYQLWLSDFANAIDWVNLNDDIQIILAPSFPFIVPLSEGLKDLYNSNKKIRVYLSSQDISKYKNGAHTGFVGASQLANIIDYSIIGHSERRADGESAVDINEKIRRCLENDIKPIVCVSEVTEVEDISVELRSNCLIAYEPISAISTSGVGKPATLSTIKEFASSINLPTIIYGGSVSSENIINYLDGNLVSGFLIGSASLDPLELAKIISKINQVYVTNT